MKKSRILTEEQADTLIYRYLTSQTTPEEEKVLALWLEQPQNASHYVQMAFIWSVARTMDSGSIEMDRRRMLARLNARIDASDSINVRRGQGRDRLWRRLGGAAAIAVAASLALAFFFGAGSREENPPQEEMLCSLHVNSTDEIEAIIMEDGSKVWLGSGSSIRWNVAGGDERAVILQGSAYFNVKSDTLKPFVVRTRDVDVVVLGTCFCVDAPEGKENTEIMLESGSVRLRSLEGVNLVRLCPNQKAVCYSATDDIEVSPCNVTPYIVEHFNKVAITDATIDEIIDNIGRIYGVTITAGDGADHSRRYNFSYNRNDTLPRVMHILEVLTGEKCIIPENAD